MLNLYCSEEKRLDISCEFSHNPYFLKKKKKNNNNNIK